MPLLRWLSVSMARRAGAELAREAEHNAIEIIYIGKPNGRPAWMRPRRRASAQCPLMLQERRESGHRGRSGLCHEETWCLPPSIASQVAPAVVLSIWRANGPRT